MYHILFIVQILASGELGQMQSRETYPSLAACEEALPARTLQVQTVGLENNAWATMATKCVPVGDPA